MTQPSEGQRRQELLFELEAFKNDFWKRDMPYTETQRAFEDLVTILMKGL